MELRRKSDDSLPPEEPRSELSDPLEAAAVMVASGDHDGAVRLLIPYVQQQLAAGDVSFRMQVPGIYPMMQSDRWAEAIAERIVDNLEAVNASVDAALAEAESEEDESRVATWLARALLLIVALESANLFRDGENDAFLRSGRTDVWKVWVHDQQGQTQEPRSSHVAMDGETVHCVIGQDNLFSNGMRWPRDVVHASAEEVIGCKCGINYRTIVEV